ncbi:glycoside hydrolase family 32 protein [Pararhizobium sp. A13]|uniref:glycoside hydrolase family 32 protein n=1 Tax=Pararhizobium sp. A13 TaxID=3133975 RepID=UPI00311AE1A7
MVQDIYRPRFHFAPAKGWMNDPNGLIRLGDSWHLFYQHDPDSISHGPMHWGHAVSRDLVTWEHLPVALAPDELGCCFSGSAIRTPDGEVKLFYTSHRVDANGRDDQHQCLVHADADLAHFVRDAKHPVLSNRGENAFRDPKVIWHDEGKRWIMLITLGQSIAFYSSTNLTEWVFESVFGNHGRRHHNHPWECPDLVRLATPDGETAWVLIVGIGGYGFAAGSGTQYFVGDFDGSRFINANAPELELWADFGRDYYAAQCFFDDSDAPPVMLAWASNWDYAKQTPAKAFRGVMSLPRMLGLERGPDGLRLVQTVPEFVRSAFDTLTPGDHAITSGTFRIVGELEHHEGQETALHLFGADLPQFRIVEVEGKRWLHIFRQEHWAEAAVSEAFFSDYAVDLPQGSLDFEVYVDNGLVELGLCRGRVWVTMQHFPADPQGAVRLVTHRTVSNCAAE